MAESGYEDDSPAFFPLYPLLVCGMATLIGGPICRGASSTVGVSVSLAVFRVALYFVYRIAEEGWGVRAAERAVLSLYIFSTSFFSRRPTPKPSSRSFLPGPCVPNSGMYATI